MYDTETELNYLNARYYNSAIGRFISEDPMFWSFDKAWLADPQNQNSYAYARNNPIGLSDPSGLLTAFFPGTWTESKNISSNFISDFKNTFAKQGSGDNFWMPAQKLYDNDASRQAVAQEFTDYLSTYQFAEGETLNVGGWSHGGNAAIISNNLYEGKIDNLVTLGTPVRADYSPDYSKIGSHYNAYSNLDVVQTLGGGQAYGSTLKGAALGALQGSLFGTLGTLIGAGIGAYNGAKEAHGEFGPAGRTYSGAENVNVTWQSGKNPISAHTNMPNTSVWSKIDQKIKK